MKHSDQVSTFANYFPGFVPGKQLMGEKVIYCFI